MTWEQVGTIRFRRRELRFEDTIMMRYFRFQIKCGYAPIMLICGRQRTGKTFAAMTIAEYISAFRGQKFSFSDMFFKIEDMAQRYDEESKKVFILDEAGIDLNVYEGNQLHQRVFQKIIESQAVKQNILLIVLPHARDIGAHHFHHVNCILEMTGRGKGILKYVWMRYGELSKKPPYIEPFEYLRDIPLPSTELSEKYLAVGQSEYKQKILSEQIGLLTQRRLIKEGKRKPKEKVAMSIPGF